MMLMTAGNASWIRKPERGGVVSNYRCRGREKNQKSIVRPEALHQSHLNAVSSLLALVRFHTDNYNNIYNQ